VTASVFTKTDSAEMWGTENEASTFNLVNNDLERSDRHLN
jgi:hypothetical protein